MVCVSDAPFSPLPFSCVADTGPCSESKAVSRSFIPLDPVVAIFTQSGISMGHHHQGLRPVKSLGVVAAGAVWMLAVASPSMGKSPSTLPEEAGLLRDSKDPVTQAKKESPWTPRYANPGPMYARQHPPMAPVMDRTGPAQLKQETNDVRLVATDMDYKGNNVLNS